MSEANTLEAVNESLHDEYTDLQNENQKNDTDAELNENAAIDDEPIQDAEDALDYAAVVEDDIRILKEEFHELAYLSDITELNDPLRYAALRDLGLTPAEAYLATAKRQKKDNRSHLIATRTLSTARVGSMTDAELSAAREIFSGVSDAEIRKLYKRVTK